MEELQLKWLLGIGITGKDFFWSIQKLVFQVPSTFLFVVFSGGTRWL